MKSVLNKFKWTTLAIGIMLCVVGFTTVVLSAMQLAGKQSVDVTGMIRFTVGGALVAIGAFTMVSSFAKDGKKAEFAPMISSALIMGCGCFLMLDEGITLTALVVLFFIPLMMIYVGIVVLAKVIIYLVKVKKAKDGKFWIPGLACSIALIALGFCFILIEKLTSFIWLLVSGLILAIGVLYTIKGAKKVK